VVRDRDAGPVSGDGLGGLAWVDHPNAELRLAISWYLARGYRLTYIDDERAIVSRDIRDVRGTIPSIVLGDIPTLPKIEHQELSIGRDGVIDERPL
jgi:hypothetical protein